MASADDVANGYKILEEGSSSPSDRPVRRATPLIEVEESLGFWGAVSSLLVTMLGAGVVSYPYAVASCGYILGPLVVVVIGLFAHEAYCALLHCVRRTECTSYDDLLSLLPAVWGNTAKASLGLLLILAGTSYVIVAADAIEDFAAASPFWDDVFNKKSSSFASVILVVFPLCLTRTLAGLSAATSLCTVCVITVSFLVIYLSTVHHASAAMEAPTRQATSPGLLLRAVPIFASSVFGHMNLPRLYAELNADVKPRAERISLIACMSASALYLAIGLAGYLAFGGNIQADILAQFAAAAGEQPSIVVAQSLMLVFVICKTPLIIFPLRVMVLAVACPATKIHELTASSNMLLTAIILTSMYVMALSLPNLGLVMGILGAACVVPLTFIFPAKLQHALLPEKRAWRSAALGTTGILISVLSMYVVVV